LELSIDDLLVLFAAFAAGGIDAIVGGGGLIQTPALFGVYGNTPPAMLLGTNKFASIFGTANAAWRYSKKIAISWRSLRWLALLVLMTSAVGAFTATHVPPAVFRPLVPVLLLVVLIYVISNRQMGDAHAPRTLSTSALCLASTLIGAIGFYDGFFGPGTGSFLMFVFVRVYGYDFLNAAASARVLNVATNLAALLWFGWQGHVLWSIAIGMALCNVAGSMLGAHLAFKGGSNFVRKVFIGVVSALIVRTAWQVLG
jgi:uncharacterized protein